MWLCDDKSTSGTLLKPKAISDKHEDGKVKLQMHISRTYAC